MSTAAVPLTTPYPGLRPFSDGEFRFLIGRDRHVQDVIERLGRREAAGPDQAPTAIRFVAVIGGSGSGKSSLMRAGVVPRLRTNGLPEVGDLWESVVCTPGSDTAAANGEGWNETPIRRLARAFEDRLCEPAGSAQAPGLARAQRRDDVAELLRQPGGIDAMFTTYGYQLQRQVASNQGACLLVVIDQFEEVFHRSNRAMPDVEHLVQRVIEHFHQARSGGGNPRCFLALTMRSEHLQDCAAYIGLPEAINAGAYLVSRLDRAELREAIERPAQRYLRICQRRQAPEEARANPLPGKVDIDTALIDRLVDDAIAIRHDPDHLPLLQHALARLWQIAREREGRAPGDVPRAMRFDDLQRCIDPGASATGTTPFAWPGNVLQACLEQWAEYRYRALATADRQHLDALLHQLAYKEPQKGTYTQQRYPLQGTPEEIAALRRMLQPHWLDEVCYLDWDDRNPQAMSLKVAHEAIVRNWKRFKEKVDADARRYARFEDLVEWCSDWVAGTGLKQRFNLLLDVSMWKRLREARLDDGLGRIPPLGGRAALDRPGYAGPLPPRWKQWREWADADAVRPAPGTAAARTVRGLDLAVLRRYMVLSGYKARTWQALLPVVMVLAVLISALAWRWNTQEKFIDKATAIIKVADQTLASDGNPEPKDIGDNKTALRFMRDAAGRLDPKPRVPHAALTNVLEMAVRTVDPAVNEKLRTLLTTTLWAGPAGALEDPQPSSDAFQCPGMVRIGSVPGHPRQVLYAKEASDPTLLMLVEQPDGDREAARQRACSEAQAQPLTALPPAQFEPHVAMDERSGVLFFVYEGAPDTPRLLSMLRLAPDAITGRTTAQDTKVSLQGPAADALFNHIAATGRRVLPAKTVLGGQLVQVGTDNWRIVSALRSTRVPDELVQHSTVDLLPDASQKCTDLAERMTAGRPTKATNTVETGHLLEDGHCLLRRSIPAAGGRVAVTTLEVYRLPGEQDKAGDGLAAMLPKLMAISLDGVEPDQYQWFRGRHCTEGWLLYRRKPDPSTPAADTSDEPLMGVPWSTKALAALAGQALDPDDQCSPDRPATRGVHARTPPKENPHAS